MIEPVADRPAAPGGAPTSQPTVAGPPVTPDASADARADDSGLSHPDRRLATGLAEATRDLAAEPDIDGALKAIIDIATESVSCDDASVTVRLSGGRFQTLAPTDDRVREADRLQYELGEGPCVAATFVDGMFLVDDLARDERWPRWGPRAAELGMRSIISLHLYTTSMSVGALNLYGRREQQYTADDVELARIVAAHASAALARLRIEQDLWSAIDSRHLIGQAQGVLIARLGISTEAAFSWLQRYSQHSNRKLRDVADEIVRTRQVPGPHSLPTGRRHP